MGTVEKGNKTLHPSTGVGRFGNPATMLFFMAGFTTLTGPYPRY